MLRELTQSTTVYLVTGYSDLQKGIEGLAAVVQGSLSLDPINKSLYLFCGRRRDRIKGLLWEGDGFLLLYKRLDNGVFRWPRNETEARLLTEQEIRWLLEGLEIEQPKAIKESKPGILYCISMQFKVNTQLRKCLQGNYRHFRAFVVGSL